MGKQFGKLIWLGLGVTAAILIGRAFLRRRDGYEVETVLIAGLYSTSGPSPSQVEFYSRLTSTFSPATSSMMRARQYHTATVLLPGRVLLTGGRTGGNTVWEFAEIYDANSNSFSPTALPMARQRVFHTATSLGYSTVLIAGGQDSTGAVHDTAEIYDSISDTFTLVAPLMPHSLSHHTATLLLSWDIGPWKVLLVGDGFAFLFDPLFETFTTISSPTSVRSQHTATWLGRSRSNVLIAGGRDASGMNLNTAELYRAANNNFTPISNMTDSRAEHTATRLKNGKVLIAGGIDNNGIVLDRAELFDPATNTFTPTSGRMTRPRYRHTATLLASGHVLIAAGEDDGGDLATAEIYSPVTDTFAPTGRLNVPRSGHTATSLSIGE